MENPQHDFKYFCMSCMFHPITVMVKENLYFNLQNFVLLHDWNLMQYIQNYDSKEISRIWKMKWSWRVKLKNADKRGWINNFRNLNEQRKTFLRNSLYQFGIFFKFLNHIFPSVDLRGGILKYQSYFRQMFYINCEKFLYLYRK